MVFALVLRTLLHRERTYVKYAEGYGRLEPQKVITFATVFTAWPVWSPTERISMTYLRPLFIDHLKLIRGKTLQPSG
ncbi:Cytochrome P450 monooxygenase lnaC [Frankliniella fusca]|uniref:Cytochrome P450 monooxygenase lnaC n=1 Tax=Frankliniella fusca TaxID=407009 RepID=A0AAE1I4J8_9NEOP|nr:Cytochrome P450 monooxygenase lnaC [Frankliniella fusca]